MAINIDGTTVIDNGRNATNINDVSASGNINLSSSTGYLGLPSGTTAERPSSPLSGEIRFNTDENSLEQYDGSSWASVGEGLSTLGSLDQTIGSGESVSLILSDNIIGSPLVSVTKEVPQIGVTNNDWVVTTDSANFTLHDTAYDTTLTPSSELRNGIFTLGSGSFVAEDVGKLIVGNGGEAILTATDGSYNILSSFNDTNTIPSNNWNMFATSFRNGLTFRSSGFLEDLSTPNSFTFANPVLFYIKPDGTKFYASVYTSSEIREYDLSTPYDITTATYSNNSLIVPQGRVERGIFFRPDGLVLYYSATTGIIYQYNLSTPWNISTASDSGKILDVNNFDPFSPGIYFKPDGLKLYVLSNNKIFEFDLSSAWNIDTASYTGKSFDFSSVDIYTYDLEFSENGDYILISTRNTKKLYLIQLLINWDISSAEYFGDYADLVGSTGGLSLSTAGDFLYIADYSGDNLRQYSNSLNILYTSGYNTSITSVSIDSEFWTDINSMTADDAVNNGAVYYAVSTDDRTTWSIIDDSVTNETENLSVTVATGELYQGEGSTGNVFYIDGNENPTMGLTRGNTYVFDQSDPSNSNHPLRFQLSDGTSYTDGVTANGTPGTSGANTTFVVPADAPSNLEYYCDVHGIGMGGPISIYDLKNTRDIVRVEPDEWQINTASGYLTEIWAPATTNDEFSALEEAATVTTNRMDATQLNAVADANHYTLGNDLDLAITLFIADGNGNPPTSDGVSINYDANVKNQVAVLDTDYDVIIPSLDTVQITNLSPSSENYKIRIV